MEASAPAIQLSTASITMDTVIASMALQLEKPFRHASCHGASIPSQPPGQMLLETEIFSGRPSFFGDEGPKDIKDAGGMHAGGLIQVCQAHDLITDPSAQEGGRRPRGAYAEYRPQACPAEPCQETTARGRERHAESGPRVCGEASLSYARICRKKELWMAFQDDPRNSSTNAATARKTVTIHLNIS